MVSLTPIESSPQRAARFEAALLRVESGPIMWSVALMWTLCHTHLDYFPDSDDGGRVFRGLNTKSGVFEGRGATRINPDDEINLLRALELISLMERSESNIDRQFFTHQVEAIVLFFMAKAARFRSQKQAAVAQSYRRAGTEIKKALLATGAGF